MSFQDEGQMQSVESGEKNPKASVWFENRFSLSESAKRCDVPARS